MKGQVLYFLRHGQTLHNIDLDYAKKNAHEDISLNQEGINQIVRIRAKIKSIEPVTICVSPLARARQTADILAEEIASNFYILPDLRECDFITWHRLAKASSLETLPPEAKPFCKQVLRGISQALRFSGPVVVVGHGGVFQALALLWNLSYRNIANGELVQLNKSLTGKWLFSQKFHYPA